MSFLKISALLFIVASLNSCVTTQYATFGQSEIPDSEELRGFAFASSKSNQSWTESQKAIVREMERKNYFYDNEQPDLLIFTADYSSDLSLLTGNRYTTSSGKTYLEPTKVRTNGNTVLIQLVETQNYETVWRGFSSGQSARFLAVKPSLSRSILNQ